jgi:RNA polymerase sigma-70 factor (family 1)
MTSKSSNTSFWKVHFETNFRKHYRPLSYFAYQFLGDRGQAEDVVQNVFLKLLDDKPEMEGEDHLKHYLYKSVRNACLNQMRQDHLHAEILDSLKPEESVSDNDPDFLQSVVRAEVYREIMDAINELPAECSRVFKMAYLSNLDNEEIAETLSISIHTVKSQKSKAKKRLRERLKNLYPLLFLMVEM